MIERVIHELKSRGIQPKPVDTVGCMADLVPLKRMGSLEEVADMALFLGSARARYVTGAIIPVDGGISLVGGRDLSAGLNP